MDVGPRLSMIDASGKAVFGPLRDAKNSLQNDILVDGKKVATLLAPVPQFALEKATSGFVRSQLKNIFGVAAALILFAALVSIWLGKHLVQPIAGLRRMTQQIASGQFHSRVEVLSQDELGGLAQQINLMAKSLELNEKKRRKVMADLSHELRTPLTVMRAEVEAVLDGVRPLNEETIKSLEAEIAHLNKLVDDLHQLALADAGDLRFHFSNVDLKALLLQIGERFQARMQKAQLTLQLDLPEQAVNLRADSGRLTQVIENILENSLRYTDAPGCVRICLSRETGFVRLDLEDSSPCLADGNYEKMFDRLYREDKARSRVKGGSGLGLAICRTLVRAHHGEIQATPSVLGGVKISIVLPS
jgi:two-component system sensor histidine kinase BaeS